MEIKSVALKRRVLIAIAACVLLSIMPVTKTLAEQLRVGVTPSVHSALIHLADAQGFFRKQGVDVAIKAYQSGHLAISDLAADKIDIAAASEIAFVLQSFKHRDLRIVTTIWSGADNELIVRKDRGITGPQDMKGRRIAVTRGSSAEFFFYNYLIFNSIPAGSVQLVDTIPSQMVKTIVDGTVDAAISWPPYTNDMAKQLGANCLRWPAQSGQNYYFTVFGKEGFVKKQSKMMEQFLAALSDAEAFTLKHPGPGTGHSAWQVENRSREPSLQHGRDPFPTPVDPGPSCPHGTRGKMGNPQQDSWTKRDAQLSRLLLLQRP